jgi:hypothetical protein
MLDPFFPLLLLPFRPLQLNLDFALLRLLAAKRSEILRFPGCGSRWS